MANKGRGLASASKAIRIRVAREGGKASHGGGRKKSSDQTYYSKVTPVKEENSWEEMSPEDMEE